VNNLNEKELVEKAKEDPKAFVMLFDKYYNVILSYAYHRTLDMELAKDITSETFLKAFNSISRFTWREINFGAWLYRIATNEVNMYFRKGKYKPVSLNYLHYQFGFDAIDFSTTELEQNRQASKDKDYEDFIFLQSKIKDLPVKYQEVLALRYFEHKSIKEIAAILEKKEGTIKSLLSRGIDRLKMFLQ
jgi:RNA polymerase sigma-70 factor (ECF subfamily)